ncbi:Complement component C1q receptor [Oryzias melastigma]|uniref:Complement component C1q receptor n=1 Tax=Oryzias melastigma TaxID=30732 RepID=A0A834L2D5_ORYME|nr:Complement component C1q receptor [Oryzias melastigma]
MGFQVGSSAALLVLSLWTVFVDISSVLGQDLQERDAICTPAGCYVVHFQRKIFLDSWRTCKQMGGNLATIKRKEDAAAIASLFSTLDLRQSRSRVRVWIGLQRQPRQCTPARPLRGFSWTTGDQDTQYTNWQSDYNMASCMVPRCVVLRYGINEHADNFKWMDGSCSVPVDGFLCHYSYRGMCPALRNEGGGNPFYATPFNLMSTLLTHVPFGSVATVPCPPGTREGQPVLCTLREDGRVGWSRGPPFCSDLLPSSMCEINNGGCEQLCRSVNGHFFCECFQGYELRNDGLTCERVNICDVASCEYECLTLMDNYRCACPEGYMLKRDQHNCEDVNECLQSPCEQLCENTPGSFHCSCHKGFFQHYDGRCQDIDECLDDPCDQVCENTRGSFICHCSLGYENDPDDLTQCQDIDECQSPDACEHMCANSEGSYECYCKEGYELMADQSSCVHRGSGEHQSIVTTPYYWVTHQREPAWDVLNYDRSTDPSHNSWPAEMEKEDLDWLTKPTSQYGSEVIYVTRTQRDELDSDFAKNSATHRGEVQEKGVLSTVQPSTSPSPTSDWYYDNVEEGTTTALPLHSTSTVVGGAANLWPKVSPSTQSPGDSSHQQETGELQAEMSDFPEDESKEQITCVGVARSNGPAAPSEFTSSPPLLGGDGGSGDSQDSVKEDQDLRQSGTWLLVGLLVPICIFIVVMAALGIVFCTRCTSQPKNKKSSDCYHWISGAHDKQGGADPSAGAKAQV